MFMENILLSVIMPVYNAETWLDSTIQNILLQSYPYFELLIVDDGSKDASLDICMKYADIDNRVHVYHKQNGGVSSARNFALDFVQGNYIVFCDSDDIPQKNWLLSFVENIGKDIDLVVTGFVYKKKENETKYQINVNSKNPIDIAEGLSIDNTFGYIWNKCFRTKIINTNHIRFDENAIFLEDEHFICCYWRFVKKVAISSLTEYVYNVPDFNLKYGIVDNYYIYVKMLKNAKNYIPTSKQSEMLRKYSMGCFRCMLLPFQRHQYREAWNRLRDFVSYGSYFKNHNRYMRIITKWNYIVWFPLLIIYTAIKNK